VLGVRCAAAVSEHQHLAARAVGGRHGVGRGGEDLTARLLEPRVHVDRRAHPLADQVGVHGRQMQA
jgi:hypothetical protein